MKNKILSDVEPHAESIQQNRPTGCEWGEWEYVYSHPENGNHELFHVQTIKIVYTMWLSIDGCEGSTQVKNGWTRTKTKKHTLKGKKIFQLKIKLA